MSGGWTSIENENSTPLLPPLRFEFEQPGKYIPFRFRLPPRNVTLFSPRSFVPREAARKTEKKGSVPSVWFFSRQADSRIFGKENKKFWKIQSQYRRRLKRGEGRGELHTEQIDIRSNVKYSDFTRLPIIHLRILCHCFRILFLVEKEFCTAPTRRENLSTN